MKKLIALLLVLTMSASLPVFVQAEEGDVSYTETLLIDYNGDDKLVADAYGCSFENVALEYLNEEHKNVIKSLAESIWLYKGAYSQYVSILDHEIDLYIPELPSKQAVLMYGSYKGSSAKAYLWLNTNGTITVGYNAENTSTQAITLGWVKIKVVLDVINRTYNFTITDANNTISLSCDLPETNTDGTINRYAYGVRFNNSYISDNIKVIYKVKNYKTTTDFLDANDTPVSADAAEYENAKIKLTFSETMDDTTVIADNFKLTSALGKDIPFTGAYDATNKTYIITPSEALRPKTEHTLTVTGLKTALGGYAHYTGDAPAEPATTPQTITFTTKKQPFAIGAVADAGSNTYNVTVANTSGVAKTGYIIAFNRENVTENGVTYSKVTGIDIKPVSAAADGTTTPVAVTTGSADPEIHLMSGDGNFTLLDIWGE
ncbi:MAG: Ig-like domain-containing protein [Clostridia bacterium]|nr:Ig-like domain-containing protein [Clostridia bacterium]